MPEPIPIAISNYNR